MLFLGAADANDGAQIPADSDKTFLLQTDCSLPGVRWARQVRVIAKLRLQSVARLPRRRNMRVFSLMLLYIRVPF